jgi:hypothetical protein
MLKKFNVQRRCRGALRAKMAGGMPHHQPSHYLRIANVFNNQEKKIILIIRKDWFLLWASQCNCVIPGESVPKCSVSSLEMVQMY